MSGSCHVLLALWKLNMELFLLPVVGNISIYVKGQNYIQVKIIQRRVDPYFLFFLALIIHWIRAGYKGNCDLTKLIGQIKIPGGGEYSLKPYGYVPSHRVAFLRRFGLKTGIYFAHFGLESSVVFEGTAAAYERIYRFNSKWVRKKEKYANSKWMKNLFVWAPI